MKKNKKMGITRLHPDGGVKSMKKNGISRPCPDSGVTKVNVMLS